MNRQRPQFGKGKSSTYLPAVLRATEPPKCVKMEHDVKSPPMSPVESIKSFWKGGFPKSTTFSSSFNIPIDGILQLEGLGKVTGPPTRVHWKADVLSKHCDLPSALCTRTFSIFWRRHHCRRCGMIFCHLHSLYTIPLDQDANFHPLGTPSRVCGRCLAQCNSWIERHSSAIKENGSDINDHIKIEISTAPLKIGLLPPDSFQSDQISDVAGSSEMGISVPNDWNWSTF